MTAFGINYADSKRPKGALSRMAATGRNEVVRLGYRLFEARLSNEPELRRSPTSRIQPRLGRDALSLFVKDTVMRALKLMVSSISGSGIHPTLKAGDFSMCGTKHVLIVGQNLDRYCDEDGLIDQITYFRMLPQGEGS
jgi:hypothetical protein